MSATGEISFLPSGPPARAPRTAADQKFNQGLRISFALHLGFFALIIMKALVFPSNETAILPTLRVDIVGLPDQLKGQVRAPAPQTSDEISKLLKKAEQDAKSVKKLKTAELPKEKAPVEKAQKDEMVLKPKQATESAETEKKRERKMESALARIKALAKIQGEDQPSNSKTAGELIKGNKISRGSSLSGEAREALVASYYDSLRDRLNENFGIPVWLSRQELSAQIKLFIDGHGGVRGVRLLKSSGNAQFDALVRKAVEESQPFPPPPAELGNSLLSDGISVGFPL